MWEIKAGTAILVCAPFGKVGGKATVVSNGFEYTDTQPWKPYTTKEDKIYDKEDVWDIVAVMNNREDVPMWAKHNIELSNSTEVIVRCNGKYARVNRNDITYLD